jgi:6-pyruvoyltetrahydropterin/6-carboxytetrahydropterin synthase
MRVAREFRFEAAHSLPDHPGKCRRLHGHGYRLTVVCEAPVDPRTGISIDFADLKRVVEEHVIEPLDHTFLNETIAVSSAENVAAWIFDRLRRAGLPVREVVLHETEDCFVVHRGE